MDVGFLTPLGGLLALVALVPLAVLVLRERRARLIRRTLGLAQPSPRRLAPVAAALAAVGALLGLAATQPIVETERTVRERTEAEAFVLVDISRSMLAASRDGAPRRIDRARAEAARLRAAIPEVPVGVLTLTDRLLPHLFPTTDRAVFRSTLERAIGIERPPPRFFFSSRATNLQELGTIRRRGYFSPSARRRLLVVLTDGESQPVDGSLQAEFGGGAAGIRTVFVQLWRRDERIYDAGAPERAYLPDATAPAALRRVAELTGGEVYGEGDRAAAQAVTAAVGTGPTRARVLEGERRALMPYAAALVLLPLGLVLLRRNL